MTVLSSEMRVLGTASAVLPRVNLLPPEIAERRAFRRLQACLGAAGAGAVVVAGLLYLSAAQSVSNANEELAAAKTETTRLQGDVAKYNDVTAIYSAAEAAQAQLVVAMKDEVRYSQLLNDLSLAVPSNVWITNLTFAQGVPGSVAGATAAGGAGAAAPTLAVGTLSVTGVGFSHDDVAAWLEALAGLKTYSNPYFSNSTEALIGTRKTVNFTSSASLTDKALSGRYLRPAGS